MRRILNGRNRGAVPEVPRVGVGRMSTLRAAREADNEWRGTGGARGLHQRLELVCGGRGCGGAWGRPRPKARAYVKGHPPPGKLAPKLPTAPGRGIDGSTRIERPTNGGALPPAPVSF